MTDVNKSNTRKINSFREAFALYAPPPRDMTGKVGVEVEMPLYRPGPAKPQIPSAEDMQKIQQDLQAREFDAQLEPSGVLEYASPAEELAKVPALARRIQKDLKDFERAAACTGYAAAPFCVLPTTTRAEAWENMVSRERLQASLAAMPQLFPRDTLDLPLLTAGVQVSFSPKDADEMLRMMYRAYALSPLLMAAMNSFTGYIGNDPGREDILLRPKRNDGYGSAGGIAESFLKSETGTDLIRNHIEAVFQATMHYAVGLQGEVILSTKENPLTFEKLIAMGLNTQTNYEIAESFLYNDIKICNLRRGGAAVGKRMEVRPADFGAHQAVSTLLLAAALVPDGETAKAFERLLGDYGFTGSPVSDAALFLSSRKAAVEHGGKFMDVAFGTGRLRDFAADVAGLVTAHYAGQRLDAEVSRVAEILLTGECDAKKMSDLSLIDIATALQAKRAGNQDLICSRNSSRRSSSLR